MPAGVLVTLPLPVPARFTVMVGGPLNVAPTLWSALIVTVQGGVPEQAPVHPPKTDPEPGAAFSWTAVPGGKKAWHAVPPGGFWQLIPGGLLVTVPVPLAFPPRVTVSEGFRLNTPVTWRSALMVRLQPPVPLQAPLHPPKFELASGVALTLTALPAAKLTEQSGLWLPQFNPAGLLVRLPLPEPLKIPVSTNGPAPDPPVRLTFWGLQC